MFPERMSNRTRDVNIPPLTRSKVKSKRGLTKPMRATLAVCFLLACSADAAAVISPDHPELLQQGILAAYTAGQKSVMIPAGVYLIPSQKGVHLELDNLTNFEIDARGATFIFQDVTATGISFYGCDSVLFHGATLYYGTPPFSQGVIQAVAADGSSLDVKIETGYPTNLDDPRYFTPQLIGHLFDSTTRSWKRNVDGDIYGTKTQRLGTDTFRVFTSSLAGGVVGDLVGFRSGTGDHVMRVTSSSRMTITDLTILNSANFGVAEGLGGDLGPNHYSSITIKRGPRPPGATTDPLFSTGADGLNSTEARQGPYVENCSFQFMPDDGIAVSGHYSWVMESQGNTLIVSNTSSYSGTNFVPGDPLRLIDSSDQVAGEAVVTNVIPLPNYQNSRKSQRTTVEDFTVGPYYQITLDRTLKASFDYLAGNPNASSSGFVLLNNTIMNNRERGMNLKGDNGIVEGNTINGSTVAGIALGPEFYWAASGYNHNLVIRNNTISNVGYWNGATAAIVVATDAGPTAAGGVQNILIDGNTFENFDVLAMFLSSSSGVVVSNNTFRNLQNSISVPTNNLGEDVIPGTVIFVTESDAVQFQGNGTSQLGPFNTTFVEASLTAKVQGVAYTSVVAGSDQDFSSTQGANNWYYGYFPSGNVNAFTLLPVYNPSSNWWQHTTFGPPWTIIAAGSGFHPNSVDDGGEEWATRRWMSTLSGTAKITGHLAKNDTNPASTGVYGRIYKNHNLIYEHFIAGTDGTGVDYSITAPMSPGDILDFAVAPNGNNDSNDSTLFSSSIILTTSPISPGSGPSITGVSNAASGEGGLAPGTFISIYGSNFAPAGFFDDLSKSVIGGKLPVKLDGVSVTVGGQAAYVAAVTPNQINVLTPNLATGSVSVAVTTTAGTSSSFFTDTTAVEPSLFTWPGSPAVATHLDYSAAVENGTFSMSTVASQPGETIILWGTGFGTTTPPAPDGQVVPPGAYTLDGVSVTLGEQPVNVLGTAMSPGLAGVYQIAIQIPASLANGNYPVVATVNGTQSPSSVLITVQK
jgi:uncharacterized protein (TIGR03437 family)